MTKDLVWRLKNLPEAGEIADLVSTGVITKEEAREILFKPEALKRDEESEQVKSLKEQVEFQQQTIDKLINKLSSRYDGWTFVNTYTPRYPTQYWMTAGSTTLTSSKPFNGLSIKENVVSYNLGSGTTGTSGGSTTLENKVS